MKKNWYHVFLIEGPNGKEIALSQDKLGNDLIKKGYKIKLYYGKIRTMK